MQPLLDPVAFLVPLNFAVFALVLGGVYAFNRHLSYVLWFTAICVLSAVGFLIEAFPDYFDLGPFRFDDWSNLIYLIVSALHPVAMGRRYNVAVPWRLLTMLVIAGITAHLFLAHFTSLQTLRVAIVDMFAALLILLCLPSIWSNQRHRVDSFLLICFTLIAATFIFRLSFILHYSITEFTYTKYAESLYMQVFYLSSGVMSLVGGFVILLAVATDILEGYNQRIITDPLTGALNRTGFLDAFATAQKYSRNSDQAMVLAQLDIDHFKNVNDRWGHAAGDDVLKKVADIMRSTCRDSGRIARYGGEEFVILLTGSDVSALAALLEKLRLAIAGTEYDSLSPGAKVTASIGASLVRFDDDLETALERADLLLYDAKQNGRNIVVLDPSLNEWRKGGSYAARHSIRPVYKAAFS